MKLKKQFQSKKNSQSKTNSYQKNKNQIWYKNKMNFNGEWWNWKTNSIKKMIKNKINSNEKIRTKSET
jgi:hypothetical protein